MTNGRYAVVGIVLAGVIAGGIGVYKKMHPAATQIRVLAADYKTKGPSGAPVQIVEYSDFQCPACKTAQPAVGGILAAYPDKVQFVFRHFPLPGHRFSGIAHAAAQCAAQQGRFWEYHDRLYDQQEQWSKSDPSETFLVYARDLGLNLDTFASCLTGESVRREILLEKSRGEAMKITATPTFFINGERLVGPLEFKTRAEGVIRKALGLPEKNESTVRRP